MAGFVAAPDRVVAAARTRSALVAEALVHGLAVPPGADASGCAKREPAWSIASGRLLDDLGCDSRGEACGERVEQRLAFLS